MITYEVSSCVQLVCFLPRSCSAAVRIPATCGGPPGIPAGGRSRRCSSGSAWGVPQAAIRPFRSSHPHSPAQSACSPLGEGNSGHRQAPAGRAARLRARPDASMNVDRSASRAFVGEPSLRDGQTIGAIRRAAGICGPAPGSGDDRREGTAAVPILCPGGPGRPSRRSGIVPGDDATDEAPIVNGTRPLARPVLSGPPSFGPDDGYRPRESVPD
jgi:hypothetical protein